MSKFKLANLLIMLMIFAKMTWANTIYTWVDAQGNTQFSETPPESNANNANPVNTLNMQELSQSTSAQAAPTQPKEGDPTQAIPATDKPMQPPRTQTEKLTQHPPQAQTKPGANAQKPSQAPKKTGETVQQFPKAQKNPEEEYERLKKQLSTKCDSFEKGSLERRKCRADAKDGFVKGCLPDTGQTGYEDLLRRANCYLANTFHIIE